ncbi:MAG: OmpA family protein [Deltaproteobacteria bacterium]|nr:OmpA family protein [Deltaproteobacteria bacterium]
MWWPFGSVHKPNRRVPRRRQRPSPVFSVYRPPSYQRPSVQPYALAPGQWSATAWGKDLRMWSLRPQWFILSVVAHILLLGELATVLFPASVSERSAAVIPVHLNQAQTTLRADISPTRFVNRQEPKATPPPADASLEGLRQFHAAATARTNQLERKFVELAQSVATKAHTIALQQQQLEAAQQESTRLTEEVAARMAAEQEAARRLAEEQARRAQLEAEVAEQQHRYEAALQSARETYHTLLTDLQGEIARKDITIREFTDRLSINIVDQVLFPSGQATLTPEGKRVLGTIGQVLAKVTDRRIQIEGHTDTQEIGPELKKLFASNWELSAARATEVVRYLLAHTSLPAEHLLAVGRADTVPVASNANEAGRRLNRRIEILLMPLAKPMQAEHGSKEGQG